MPPGGRPLLLAGFGSLLLLLFLAGGYALGTLEQVRTSDLRERNNYLTRDRALDRGPKRDLPIGHRYARLFAGPG